KPQNKDWQTFQGFLAYKAKDFQGGLLFASQTRENPGGKDTRLNVTSFYANYSASTNVKPFFRADWVSDPVPGAENIAYFAMSSAAKPTFYLFGVDYAPIKDVHIIPNVEMVKYSSPVSGPTPKDDVFYRLTFFYVWK
ncbi:MAG: hypothetical protein ACK4G3_04985, partial [bacterium]